MMKPRMPILRYVNRFGMLRIIYKAEQKAAIKKNALNILMNCS